ncbi:MAG: SDR family oxidoreductase [Anaerolineae bacterium]|nr:SDR family oxidoreductase [Anaerolineae bacterium]
MTTNGTRRVALITGASKGLGYSLGKFLAMQNYDLVVTARGAQRLDETAQAFASSGARVKAVAGNVSDAQHRQQLFEVVSGLGRLDLLVNNASILGPLPMPALKDYPPEALLEVLNINMVAPVALVQSMLPFLSASHGLIVNLTSDAAVGGYEGWGGYGASKAALDLVTRTLANELRASGIGVVSVDPGDLRTDMHQDAFPGEDISDRPLPDVTLPFWAWLLGQDPLAVSGQRFQAQAELWETAT